MKLIDLLTFIFLAIGLILAIAAHILIKRRILLPTMWPRVLGIGSFVFGFATLMTASILLRPRSEFLEYTLTNSLLAGAVGLIAFMSGRNLARRQGEQSNGH